MKDRKPMVGIIGHGVVGKAVDKAFSDKCDILIHDPAVEGLSIGELVQERPDVFFVCVSTPSSHDGSVNADAVIEVLGELPAHTLIILKSTVTPTVLWHPNIRRLRLVYQPEFLTASRAELDFLRPVFWIFGGESRQASLEAECFYDDYSSCEHPLSGIFHVTLAEASLIKYAFNSFLATKVVWMNEFKKLVDTTTSFAEWGNIAEALKTHPWFGSHHTDVPGPDGLPGFGGACFPKDTQALLYYAETLGVDLSVLKTACETNDQLRNNQPC